MVGECIVGHYLLTEVVCATEFAGSLSAKQRGLTSEAAVGVSHDTVGW